MFQHYPKKASWITNKEKFITQKESIWWIKREKDMHSKKQTVDNVKFTVPLTKYAVSWIDLLSFTCYLIS